MTDYADPGWYLARAAGLTAWWLATAAVLWGLLLSSRFLGSRATPGWLADLHRTLGTLTVVFSLVHVAAAGLSDHFDLGPVALLVPFVPHARTGPAAWGIVTLYLLLAIAVTSALRRRIPHRLWRYVHLGAFLVFAGATVHAFLAGSDAHTGWMRASAVAAGTAALFLAVYRVAVGRRRTRAVDAAVSAARTAAAHPPAPAFHRLAVAAVERLADDAVTVAFDVPPALADSYRYLPGQHVTVRATVGGEVLRRSYSICAGLGDGELRIGVRHVPGGRMSGAVQHWRAGDVVEVMTPAGTFTDLPNSLSRRHVLGVAAGSGITPVLAVARSVLTVEPHSRVTVVYGNRTPATTMFRAALAALADRHPERLRVVHVYSDADGGRRIDADLLRELDLMPADHAYLCGPAPMVDAVRGTLVALGMAADRVRSELYGAPRPGAGGRGAGTVTVLADGGVAELAVAAGESLLDAALRQGVDIPYSCQAGACGTCRVRLVAGEVSGGADADGRILACQAGLASATAAIDLSSDRTSV
ncbi:hypothetical protein GCM10010124_10740 [Pilimelia terevasa]|uniref:Uncharacterized protein n=1 Tax=Pilimelia terevasa TaxID=53372 RepID=A0A8J3BGC7_9ACTN|nr:2Fe-2S iron-sulfur cluster-binding protein [Pilimelia terevasa]GGK19975.1 hypothetical protein GCM10010124_10740 [Pilimelia terevasa]